MATGPLASPGPELLAPVGEVVVAASGDEQELVRLVDDAVALVVRGGGSRVSGRVIDAARALRVIARTGIGVDEVDVAAATARGIPVVVAPHAGSHAVAEGALALMLALAKRLSLLDELVRDGRWAERDAVDVRDLDGATLGIVGLGRIGARLAALALPLGMRVVAFDPYTGGDRVELVPLEELFERSDFVSLHAPLTAETRAMVDATLLARARNAILVNLARGALVRSLDDLLTALEAGNLDGVGLDVFDVEPPDVSHPLFEHPRVVVSPHALGLSRSAKAAAARAAAEGVLAVLADQRPAHVANPEIYGG